MNRLWLKFHTGKFLNLIGLPAVVQQSEYESCALNAHVSVKRSELYTVVSVNGLDIYLGRLTGKIDGVGRTRGIDYTSNADLIPGLLAPNRDMQIPQQHHQANA